MKNLIQALVKEQESTIVGVSGEGEGEGEGEGVEKMDKESRKTRAHYVNVAHCFAYGVVEANEKEWDNVPHEFRPTANFTQKGDPKKQKKDKDKDKKAGGKKSATVAAHRQSSPPPSRRADAAETDRKARASKSERPSSLLRPVGSQSPKDFATIPPAQLKLCCFFHQSILRLEVVAPLFFGWRLVY